MPPRSNAGSERTLASVVWRALLDNRPVAAAVDARVFAASAFRLLWGAAVAGGVVSVAAEGLAQPLPRTTVVLYQRSPDPTLGEAVAAMLADVPATLRTREGRDLDDLMATARAAARLSARQKLTTVIWVRRRGGHRAAVFFYDPRTRRVMLRRLRGEAATTEGLAVAIRSGVTAIASGLAVGGEVAVERVTEAPAAGDSRKARKPPRSARPSEGRRPAPGRRTIGPGRSAPVDVGLGATVSTLGMGMAVGGVVAVRWRLSPWLAVGAGSGVEHGTVLDLAGVRARAFRVPTWIGIGVHHPVGRRLELGVEALASWNWVLRTTDEVPAGLAPTDDRSVFVLRPGLSASSAWWFGDAVGARFAAGVDFRTGRQRFELPSGESVSSPVIGGRVTLSLAFRSNVRAPKKNPPVGRR